MIKNRPPANATRPPVDSAPKFGDVDLPTARNLRVSIFPDYANDSIKIVTDEKGMIGSIPKSSSCDMCRTVEARYKRVVDDLRRTSAKLLEAESCLEALKKEKEDCTFSMMPEIGKDIIGYGETEFEEIPDNDLPNEFVYAFRGVKTCWYHDPGKVFVLAMFFLLFVVPSSYFFTIPFLYFLLSGVLW